MNVPAHIRRGAPALALPRLDVRGMMDTYVGRVNRIVQPLQPAIALSAKHWTLADRRADGDLYVLSAYAVDGQVLPQYRDRALEVLPQLPPEDGIREAWRELRDIIRTPLDEPTARVLIGAMLDGLRAKPTDTAATYVDVLLYTIEEAGTISPTTLAGAIADVWRTMTFPPSAAELLPMCAARREKLVALMKQVDDLLTFRWAVEEIVRESDEYEPPPRQPGDLDDDIPF